VTPGIASVTRIGSADIWSIDLKPPEAALGSELQSLSEAERERASRLTTRPEAWRRFVAGRAGLRRVLAGYLHVAPASLVLVEGPQGKPEVSNGPFFSLSHSGDLALCAVSPARRIGVDVEQLRPVAGAEQIARRWFTVSELEAYLEARAAQPDQAFLRVWTRKEAYLKALGTGLAGLSPRADVDRQVWDVHDLEPGEGYLAALVVERERGAPPAASG
jgi:4'-phosphopantetheinyl transferase